MKKHLLFCAVLAAILLFTVSYGCKKDDSTTGCPDCPVITAITPASGLPGDTVTITGKNFGGLESVLFDGVNADTVRGHTGTQIRIIAPNLYKNGPVAVQVVRRFVSGSGSVSSISSNEAFTFNYTSAPVINSFSPESGGRNDVITITGKYFGANPRVFFQSGEAEYLVKTDTLIQVRVPLKAGKGTLRVTTDKGASVNSQQVFTYQYQYSIGLFLGAPSAPGFTINVPASDARLTRITEMAGDAQGNMYIVDRYDNKYFDVMKVDKQAPYQVTRVVEAAYGTCIQLFTGPQNELYYVTDLGSPSNEKELYRTLPGQAPFRLWSSVDLTTAGIDPTGEVYVLKTGAAAGIYKLNGGSSELTAGYSVSYFTGNTFSIGNSILFDRDGGNIKRLDLSTKHVTDLYSLPLFSIHAWAYSPLGDQIYFSNNNTIRLKNGTAFDSDGGSTNIPELQNIFCFYMGADAFGNLYIRKFDTAEEPCIYKVTVE